MSQSWIAVACVVCLGSGREGIHECDTCGGSGEVRRPADMDERIDRQEQIVSALWAFAGDLQKHRHDAQNSKGVSVNLESVGHALKRILAAFGEDPIDID
jgi:RecJ-like exonuclease